MRYGITVGAAVLAFAATAPAWAQPVGSFRELAELIEIGRSVVVVTSPDGDVITGQLIDISPTSLSVFAGGRRIELDEARVGRVRQRWDDPNSDGAALGFLAGSVPPLVLYAMSSGGEEVAGLLMFTGLAGTAGALIGATLDGRRTGRMRDLYAREPRRVAVAPLVSPERVGAALAISW